MNWTTPLHILIALVLVLVNGFSVLAGSALITLRATRIEALARQGNRARIARHMLMYLDRYISVTKSGITVASLGLVWLGEPAFAAIVESSMGVPSWRSPTVSHSASAGDPAVTGITGGEGIRI